MNDVKIQNAVHQFGLKPYRQNQLRHAFFTSHVASYAEISTLPASLRRRLGETLPAMTVAQQHLQVSRDGRANKAMLTLADGKMVETVLLNPKPGLWSCCISSQVGCALNCSFCATGKMGFLRNLTSEEITDQVLFWRQYIDRERPDVRLQNVVYMGMGEPLHNKKNVFSSINELRNPHTFAIGSRHISVSTAGMTRAMVEFADLFPQVNLAVSLHAADDDLRLRLMPINKANPIAELIAACDYYIAKTRRKLFVEYILLDGENDTKLHAGNLADLILRMKTPALVHVNLIVYNATNSNHAESSAATARAFKHTLGSHGIATTIRKNLGRDIQGACGQLVVEQQQHAGSLPEDT